MSNIIKAVLFDLDGTLLDTAPDLADAINQLRKKHELPPLSVATVRSIATLGSKALVKIALGIEETDKSFSNMRESFFQFYEKKIAKTTQFFPQMETVLNFLENARIPWGIVTNKLKRHTTPLLEALKINHRPACVVCGDTLATFKPDPAPILHGCHLLQTHPRHCLYVGDAETDVKASKAAGVQSLVALYGYINEKEDPYSWKAEGYIHNAIEILEWITVSS